LTFFSINDPVDFAQWGEECSEIGGIGKNRTITEEVQLPSVVQPDQPFQNKTPVQTGQNMNGEEGVLAAGYPLCSIRRQAAARCDHMHVRVMGHR
jgi:hypothetical protein